LIERRKLTFSKFLEFKKAFREKNLNESSLRKN